MKIMIGITQKINLGGFESLSPSITMEFEIEGKDYQKEYDACYEVTKNLWNKHAYRLISGTIERRKSTSLVEWAKSVNDPETIKQIMEEKTNVGSK